MKSTLVYFLFLGLAVTFWANSLKSFFTPDQVQTTLNGSVLFSPFSQFFPGLILLIGFFNIIMALLLGTRIFPKVSTIIATLWLGAVMLVLFAHGDLSGAFDAFEHAATFAVSAYLAVLAFREKKEQSELSVDTTMQPAQEAVPEFHEETAIPEPPSPVSEEDIPVPPPPSDEIPEPPAPPKDG